MNKQNDQVPIQLTDKFTLLLSVSVSDCRPLENDAGTNDVVMIINHNTHNPIKTIMTDDVDKNESFRESPSLIMYQISMTQSL